MTAQDFIERCITRWITKIATSVIALLLASAAVGTFVMAREFSALKETVSHINDWRQNHVVQVNQDFDNVRQRVRALEQDKWKTESRFIVGEE